MLEAKNSTMGADGRGEADEIAQLEQAKEQVVKALQRDAKVKERDLYDRLVKQARAPDGCLYANSEEASGAEHMRAQFVETAAGFTQLPPALRQAAASQLEYHSFNGLFPEIHRAWMTIDHMLFL